MGEIQKYSLKEELRKADETLQGSPSLVGMTMLTYPQYINSMRSTMFTSHLKQFLNLLHPEFPNVFTSNENLVGKYSSGYKEAKSSYQVFRKVAKFTEFLDTPNVYKLFVFDIENQRYDVIERKVCEDLTENFGYDYINDVIDSYDEGDTIDKGTVLYRSTSYDEDMNYAYGRNVTVAYTLDPFTSEDAAVASRSLQKQFTSIETETMRIGLNGNDYFINYYGDKDHYRVLPRIGEKVSDIIAVSRRQFNNQLLFDFKDSTLRKIIDGDSIYYVDKDVEVIDYTIYNNNDEIIDNPFYEQINEILRSQNRYYSEIIEACEEIINSGYEYTREVDYLYKRAKEMIDTEKKWKEGDTAFSNMEIEIKIRRVVPLAKGCKVTGRFGNKSVISEIREDEDMPHTKDGRRVDLILSLLAIINRTTSMPIYEIFINGSAYQCVLKMREMDSMQEQENMLFDFVNTFNPKQAESMYKTYKKKSKKEKQAYIQDVLDTGRIYINIPSLWEKDGTLFYKCQYALEKFPFLKQDDLFINKWNREIKILNKFWVGEMYILKLKQSDRRGFSARSTGAIDTKGLPTRSFKSRSHLEQKSSSCIRFGEYESFNFSIGILPDDIALFHALYRTSLKGRKDIVSLMFSDEDDDNGMDGIIDKSYTSRVAEIFNVILKCLGMELEFEDEDDEVKVLNDNIVSHHELDGNTYMCTDYQFFLIERMYEIRDEILENDPVMTDDKLHKLIVETLKKRKYINGSLERELEMLDIAPKLKVEKIEEETPDEASDETSENVETPTTTE